MPPLQKPFSQRNPQRIDIIGNNRQDYKMPLKIGFFMPKSLLPITSNIKDFIGNSSEGVSRFYAKAISFFSIDLKCACTSPRATMI
jgi:hypothetical protein